MEHDTAVREQFAARYLLGELSEEDREAFEEHFFACPDCGNQVRAGAALAANVRALGRGEAHATGWSGLSGWFRWPVMIPVGAAAALGVLSLYQGLVVIPALKQSLQPQLVASTALHGTSRGAERTIVFRGDRQFFELAFDVNADREYEAYECEVRDATDTRLFSLREPGRLRSTTLHLLVPGSRLDAGSYVVAVYGLAEGARDELDRFRFTVTRSDESK